MFYDKVVNIFSDGPESLAIQCNTMLRQRVRARGIATVKADREKLRLKYEWYSQSGQNLMRDLDEFNDWFERNYYPELLEKDGVLYYQKREKELPGYKDLSAWDKESDVISESNSEQFKRLKNEDKPKKALEGKERERQSQYELRAWDYIRQYEAQLGETHRRALEEES